MPAALTQIQTVVYDGRLGPFRVTLSTDGRHWFCQTPGRDHILCHDEHDARSMFERACASLTRDGCSPRPSQSQPDRLHAAYIASGDAAEGFTFSQWLNDETFVCEVCGERHLNEQMDTQIQASHLTLSHVCEKCADPILARWAA